MAIEWAESLSVGVNAIDEQHKTLFDKANKLFEAGKNNQAKEFISELLDFLQDYTKKHFEDEEAYMRSINYPEYDLQVKMHTGFIAEVDKLKKSYMESGYNIMVILNANQMVVDWLLKHISSEDKKIGEYAKSLKA